MNGASVAAEKIALRARMRETIGAIGRGARAAAARRATDIALRSPPFARAGLVLAYRALPDEIDVDPLARALAARGVRLAFPLVVDLPQPRSGAGDASHDGGTTDPLRSLRLLAIDADDFGAPDAWSTDRYGIRAPNPEASIVRRVQPREIDAVIVPGRAFDARGARLGRGKGFYDALLARLRPDARAATIGLAFEAQILDRVPEDAHDARVAWIATERCLRHATRADRPPRPRSSEESEGGSDAPSPTDADADAPARPDDA